MAQFVTGSSVLSSAGSPGCDRLERFEANLPTTFSNRVHYRAVYSEVTQVFSGLTTIRDGHRAVAGASSALAALQHLDWAHRSKYGQLILVTRWCRPDQRSGVCSKTNRSRGRVFSRTVGTMNTVACEDIEQTYYFNAPGPPTMIEIPKLKYNHLHDAEFLWWCMLWLHAPSCPKGHPAPFIDSNTLGQD
ncbi:hypothetical protein FRB94_006972 [Tulasnella sp. JGI-2019a]|nr:hypothetical protein FRB94_006972 [Tulasnella sp. JGI-2019a]